MTSPGHSARAFIARVTSNAVLYSQLARTFLRSESTGDGSPARAERRNRSHGLWRTLKKFELQSLQAALTTMSMSRLVWTRVAPGLGSMGAPCSGVKGETSHRRRLRDWAITCSRVTPGRPQKRQ